MVGTKKCEKCGWIYPITHPDRSCRFCGTPFKKRFCIECGRYVELRTSERTCKECLIKKIMANRTSKQNVERYQRHRAKVLKQKENQFTNWLSMIAKVPKPLKTLTEEEWIAACLHFGKCAICKNESIDARAFFIPFAFGGRYAAWNVIPVCDKCATALKRQQNPFIGYAEAAPDIVKYLQPILERTVRNEKSI